MGLVAGEETCLANSGMLACLFLPSRANLSGAWVGTTDPKAPWHPENADLEGVDLDLTETDLSGADLSGANLGEGTVNEEQLDTVGSLEGATMPDGSMYD